MMEHLPTHSRSFGTSSKLKQRHMEHLLPPSRKVSSKPSMYDPHRAPTNSFTQFWHVLQIITKTHGAPAASFTEGQQQALHARPTQSTYQFLHMVLARPPNCNKDTWSACCLLPGGSTASPPCTTHIEHLPTFQIVVARL